MREDETVLELGQFTIVEKIKLYARSSWDDGFIHMVGQINVNTAYTDTRAAVYWNEEKLIVKAVSHQTNTPYIQSHQTQQESHSLWRLS